MTWEERGKDMFLFIFYFSIGCPEKWWYLNLIVFKLLSCIRGFNTITFLCFLLSETNLKFKMALEVTHRHLQEERALADFDGWYSSTPNAVRT